MSDLGPLSGLTGLTELDLGDNEISDISALSGLTRLESLSVYHNSVDDIDPLSGLTSLVTLALGRNAITDISALEGLTGLSLLRLHSNTSLVDIQPLVDNPGLNGTGDPYTSDRVSLTDTGVACASVDALRAKGVIVESDCP